MQTNLGNATMCFSWVMPPLSQLVRHVNIESPDLRSEKNEWSVSHQILYSESMYFDVCNFMMFLTCDVFSLKPQHVRQQTTIDGDVWRIHMRCIYSYIIIYVYIDVCTRMEAVEKQPKGVCRFCACCYAHVL
jgi:hypothetical protein